jgi:hypothetical protein
VLRQDLIGRYRNSQATEEPLDRGRLREAARELFGIALPSEVPVRTTRFLTCFAPRPHAYDHGSSAVRFVVGGNHNLPVVARRLRRPGR